MIRFALGSVVFAVVLLLASSHFVVAQTCIASGTWNDPNIWSGGQVPGPDGFVVITDDGIDPFNVSLDANREVDVLYLGTANGSGPAILNLNGSDFTTIEFLLGYLGEAQIVGAGNITVHDFTISGNSNFNFGSNDVVTSSLTINGGANVQLATNTIIPDLRLNSGAQFSTLNSNNLSGNIQVFGENTQLNLAPNDPIDVDQINIGAGNLPSVFNAAGSDITANNIVLGHSGVGIIENKGVITTVDLQIGSNSSFAFGEFDTVSGSFFASGPNTSVTLHSNTVLPSLELGSGISMDTVSDNNVSGSVRVYDEDTTLNLGADLIATDIYVGGDGPGPAFLKANGNDIICDLLFLGFASPATLENCNSIKSGELVVTSGSQFPAFTGTIEVESITSNGTAFLQTSGTLTPPTRTSLTTINADYHLNGGAIRLEVGGSNITEYDRIVVNGELEIAGGNFEVVVADDLQLAVGQTFIVIEVAGIQTGVFDGLPEGATVGQVGIANITITYSAGDGNDIGLIVQLPDGSSFDLTSSAAAEFLPISGTMMEQINELNAGPPNGSFLFPVERKSDFHEPENFDCSEIGPSEIVALSVEVEYVEPTPPDLGNDVLTTEIDPKNPELSRIFAMKEIAEIQLQQDLSVDTTEAGVLFDMNNMPQGGTIPAGQVIATHLLHLDVEDQSGFVLQIAGAVEFSSDILGVIIDGNKMIATDQSLGHPGTSYSNDPRRAWEIGGPFGAFEISADRRTLTVWGLVSNFMDQLRIITAVPSPMDYAFLRADNYLDGVDEVTFDNCSSAWYKFSFDLPVGYTNPSLAGFANVDDVGVMYLNGNRVSASIQPSDVEIDRVDEEGRPLLSSPTIDSFSVDDPSFFQPGSNEIVIGVHGDLSPLDPTGLEFAANINFKTNPLLGDVNLDGAINLLDIDPFIERIANGTYQTEADCNLDGVVDLLDIDPFITILSGG